MHPPSLPARLAVGFCRWLLARCGVEFTPLPRGSSTALFLRDRRGRFVALSKLGPAGAWGAWDEPNHGFPAQVPPPVAELLHGLGVTQRMYETAAHPLELPDDVSDVPALALALRRWILRNMEHWVNGKGRSVAPVMTALMRTWALDLYRLRPLHPTRQQRILRGLETLQASADPAATPPPAGRHNVAADYRSEPFQGVADYAQGVDSGRGHAATQPVSDLSDRDPQDLTWRRGAVAVEHLNHPGPPPKLLGQGPVESTKAWKASLHNPDPPWRGPPPIPTP